MNITIINDLREMARCTVQRTNRQTEIVTLNGGESKSVNLNLDDSVILNHPANSIFEVGFPFGPIARGNTAFFHYRAEVPGSLKIVYTSPPQQASPPKPPSGPTSTTGGKVTVTGHTR